MYSSTELELSQTHVRQLEAKQSIETSSLQLESLYDRLTGIVKEPSLASFIVEGDISLESMSLKEIIKRIIAAIVSVWNKLISWVKNLFREVKIGKDLMIRQLKALDKIVSVMSKEDIVSDSAKFDHYNPRLRTASTFKPEDVLSVIKEEMSLIGESREVYVAFYKKIINESIDLLGDFSKLKDFDKYSQTRTFEGMIKRYNDDIKKAFPRRLHLAVLPGGNRVVFDDPDKNDGLFVRMTVSQHPRTRDYRKHAIDVPDMSLLVSYITIGMEVVLNVDKGLDLANDLNDVINRMERSIRLNTVSDGEDSDSTTSPETLTHIRQLFSDKYITDVSKTITYEYDVVRGILHFVKESVKNLESSVSWSNLLNRKGVKKSSDLVPEFNQIK